MSSLYLNNYRKIVTSQHGEDGILLEIFKRIGISNRWCCEFGAWDGEYLSNIFNLVCNYGWSAVEIEGNKKKFEDLVKKFKANTSIYPLNAFVSDSYPTDLNTLLSKTPIPKDFDLLSIDIDHEDYLVWAALTQYIPKVVIIEVNSYLKPGVEKLPVKGNFGNAFENGASFTSMVKLAKAKGYELAIHTGNCIFVKSEYAHLLEIDIDSPDNLFDRSWLGTFSETLETKIKRKIRKFIFTD